MTKPKPMTPDTAYAVRTLLEHTRRRNVLGQMSAEVLVAIAALDAEAAEVLDTTRHLPASWHARAEVKAGELAAAEVAALEALDDEDSQLEDDEEAGA